MRLSEFLAGLTVSQGRRAGEPLTVLPWQRRFVRGAFAPGVQSAGLSVARGNGKINAGSWHRVCCAGWSAGRAEG